MSYLVDGNNVMAQRVGWHRDKAGARRGLLDELARFAAAKRARVTVVFDGAPVAFVLTTTNPVAPGEGPFPCTALAAVGGATNCNFVSAGNPLVGLTVAVCFGVRLLSVV